MALNFSPHGISTNRFAFGFAAIRPLKKSSVGSPFAAPGILHLQRTRAGILAARRYRVALSFFTSSNNRKKGPSRGLEILYPDLDFFSRGEQVQEHACFSSVQTFDFDDLSLKRACRYFCKLSDA